MNDAFEERGSSTRSARAHDRLWPYASLAAELGTAKPSRVDRTNPESGATAGYDPKQTSRGLHVMLGADRSGQALVARTRPRLEEALRDLRRYQRRCSPRGATDARHLASCFSASSCQSRFSFSRQIVLLLSEGASRRK
jgi:hypothetical protein